MAFPSYFEIVEDFAPGEATFERGRASVTMVLDIAWKDLNAGLVGLLGYSAKSAPGTPGASLNRNLPASHPYFGWMYATKITSFKPYSFDSTDSPATSGAGFIPSNGATQLPQYAQYDWVRLHVLFEPLPYDISSDGYLQQTYGGNEYYRYCQKIPQPRGENITLDKGQIVYNDGTNRAVAAAYSKILPRQSLLWRWIDIPEDGAYNSQLIPTNQLAAQGCVNNAIFAGYPAKTLLLMSAKYSPHNYAIEPDATVANATRAYDIEYDVIYYSPTPTTDGGAGTWNHVPDTNGKFTACKYAVGGGDLFPGADFTTLFKLN